MWALWLATRVKLPLLRPVRYVYFVSYSFGPSGTNAYRSAAGNGSAEIMWTRPMHSLSEINAIRDLIVETGPWPQTTPPALVIMNWKFLRKQVFRQKTWHDTRRRPRLT